VAAYPVGFLCQLDGNHSGELKLFRLGMRRCKSAAELKETVDQSPTFPEMLIKLEKWMDKWELKDARGYLVDAVWVTDGVSYMPRSERGPADI
jgi:hypothetical protein